MIAIVFMCAFFLDYAYVRWMKATTANQAWRAGAWSTLIGGCGLLGVTSVVTDHWLAIPYLLGLGLGSVAGVKER